MNTPVGRLGSVSLDCDDPRTLAAFWAATLGGEITVESDAVCAVELGSLLLVTVRVPDHRPPQWPNGLPKQFHLDVAVTDLDEAERRTLAAGATKATEQPNPDRWRVLLDPAGHPFCLTTLIPA
ncbi:VOC family protein [Streptomyces sp. SID14478]|uniref:VOC family protein n=1 Tax=Streptomyces sp. SID14478 TaxID=2706073 RepID=UPI0013DFB074|nr:VOC family protein [Streptomyces sp. SID14478]NEB81880.1 VOC family protein [Streptomyces sp. SID14478]